MAELEKWADAQAELAPINDFLDWLEKNGIELATMQHFDGAREPKLSLMVQTRTTLLYRYVNVDPTKLENERRDLLAVRRPSTTAKR